MRPLPSLWAREIQKIVVEGVSRVIGELSRQNQQNRTQDQQNHTEALVPVRDFIEQFKAFREHQECSDDQASMRERFTLATLIATVIFTALTFIVFYLQLEEMRRAYDPIKNQAIAATNAADAAKESADVAKKTMQIDQRAWIGVESIDAIPRTPETGKTLSANVRMRNTGKTPARNIRQVGSLDAITGAPTSKYVGTVRLAGNLSPNASATIPFTPLGDGNHQPLRLNDEILAALRAGQLKLVVHGRIDYDDVFGDPHWTTYCALLAVPFNEQFELCEGQNDTDDYKPIRK
jgi:hypothetical protein